ncbi:hypothetical protein LF1_39740 [Rubripirellula obstinata]|uniref:Virus attachment protein p12 family protein n=1 Tax=Rubripirellula obstinata TaxID=406547 RepID=A0A5B1CLM0_9BACT|nr:FeoB-associated Cys-rich membrane protein [Rubripirellula obstinata]KAA1261426.1 hypothetical protein LF1_39740 [Rubripirellula obstinata]
MPWQPIITALIVFAALVWLGRKIYRVVSSAVGGGKNYTSSCGSCSQNRPQNVTASPLIQLDAKSPSSSQSDS